MATYEIEYSNFETGLLRIYFILFTGYYLLYIEYGVTIIIFLFMYMFCRREASLVKYSL